MLAKVFSSSLSGMDVIPIEIEVDLGGGVSKVIVVGLPDEAVKESKDRVKSAVINSGYFFPSGRITINLAPATVKKAGPDFDLAFAIGILIASGQIRPQKTKDNILLGELALDGRVRRVKGILPKTIDVKKRGIEGIIIPQGNSTESGIVKDILIYPVSTLRQTAEFITGNLEIEPYKIDVDKIFSEEKEYEIDLSDVKGQYAVKRALEITAAGGHNMLMIGPPGVGKTMLAKRLPTIIPDMTIDEAIETTMVYSIVGLIKKGQTLIANRPFRAPHYSISDMGLIGGSSYPRPGEISLSHNGVLFLDELTEFDRNVLEVLRQPLEDGYVTISRARASHTFPARFMLVTAMNPCQCGYFGHPKRECRCTPGQRQKYISKISGPLLDRIDIHIEVPPVDYRKIKDNINVENSVSVKDRVKKARDLQKMRFLDKKGIYCNSQMSAKDLEKYCVPDTKGEELLQMAVTDLGLSARAHSKILKVARTIADIEGSENILFSHISEAIQYRILDRNLAF